MGSFREMGEGSYLPGVVLVLVWGHEIGCMIC